MKRHLQDVLLSAAAALAAALVADWLGRRDGTVVTMPDGTAVRVHLSADDEARLLGGQR